jgi:hypothetical protein
MPKQIDLPFQLEVKEAMLSGKKTATSRPKRYGYPGDWFPAFGKTFVLTAIQRTYLDIVVRLHYKEEGFDSPHAFVQYWNRLHPVITFSQRPSRVVFFHQFTPREESGI